MKQELVDAIKRLSREELNDVIELCGKCITDLRRQNMSDDIKRATEIGDRICDALGTNFFWFSSAWQCPDCPYELCSSNDYDQMLEMMSDHYEEDDRINWNARVEDEFKKFIIVAKELEWTLEEDDGDGYFDNSRIAVYYRGGNVYYYNDDEDIIESFDRANVLYLAEIKMSIDA